VKRERKCALSAAVFGKSNPDQIAISLFVGFRCQCSALPPAKKAAGQIEKKLLGSLPKSAAVGFCLSKYHRPKVGWVECNETQQSMELPQPNLQNAEWSEIKSTFSFQISYERHRWLKKRPV
jgi:hypothetical protein